MLTNLNPQKVNLSKQKTTALDRRLWSNTCRKTNPNHPSERKHNGIDKI